LAPVREDTGLKDDIVIKLISCNNPFQQMKAFLLFIIFSSLSGYAMAAQIIQFSKLKLLGTDTVSLRPYDEAVNLSPNFGLNQTDEGLKPYFDPANGESQLCAPTSLAHLLIYKMGISRELPISTRVPGVSADGNSIDANTLIIDLAKRCDSIKGTSLQNQPACITKAVADYFGKNVTIDYYDSSPDEKPFDKNVTRISRQPLLTDIKLSLDMGEPILASIGWYTVNAVKNEWKPEDSHKIVLYGYEGLHNTTPNVLNLFETDPRWKWRENYDVARYDLITAFQTWKNGESSIFVDGDGFKLSSEAAFLTNLIILHIQK
jgi:hypothetical protein